MLTLLGIPLAVDVHAIIQLVIHVAAVQGMQIQVKSFIYYAYQTSESRKNGLLVLLTKCVAWLWVADGMLRVCSKLLI